MKFQKIAVKIGAIAIASSLMLSPAMSLSAAETSTQKAATTQAADDMLEMDLLDAGEAGTQQDGATDGTSDSQSQNDGQNDSQNAAVINDQNNDQSGDQDQNDGQDDGQNDGEDPETPQNPEDPEEPEIKQGWQQEEDGTRYYAEDGTMQTGWQTIDNKKYYFNPDNGLMQTSWGYIDKKWYYFSKSNGQMQTGWAYLNKKWFYLNPADGIMQTGWQYINKKWYYMDTKNGDMKTGWQYINKKWYYMDPTNGDMKTGWQKVDGLYYYMDSSGAMAANKVVDGYKLASNGSNKTKALIQDIVNSHTNNAMTNDAKIKALWNWLIGNSWTYTRTYEHVMPNWVWYSGWQDDFAYQLITNKSGNCFRYAAGFGYMVKEATGYRVCVYHGMTPASRGGTTPHGWITVEIGSTWYAYDPDLYKFGNKKAIYYKTAYSTTRQSIHLQGKWVPLY